MFVLVTFAIATQLQAMVIVEYSRRAGTATVVFVMVLVISMLFGGFLVNADSTHPGVAWVQYLSLIFYAFEAMAVNEFKVRLLPLLRLGRSLLCLACVLRWKREFCISAADGRAWRAGVVV